MIDSNGKYYKFVKKYLIPILFIYLLVDYYVIPLNFIFLPIIVKK
jgi:hypothetical protein